MAVRYEIQDDFMHTYKHTFNYQANKRMFEHYSSMSVEKFTKCLKDIKNLGDILHLTVHILWAKGFDFHIYRNQLNDRGLIHLLVHCIGDPSEAKKNAKIIKDLFDKYVILS